MNTPVAGFDTDRETFLGLYNGMGEPDVPREGASTNSVASGRAPIASHGLDVPLAPGEEKTFIFTKVGEISSYRSGHKENAGIFCHNNPWIMIAETVIGRGDRAFEYYKKIAPAYIEEISEIHRTEPYVY